MNQIAASFKNNSLSLFPDLSDAVSRKQTYRILLDELSDYCRIAFSSPPYKPELALKISNLIETSLGSSSTLQDFVFLTPPPANTTTGPPSNKKQKMTVSSPPSSSTSSTNESSWNDMESYKSMSLRERQELAEGGGGGGGGKRQKSYLVPAPPPHPDELAAEHLHRRSQFGESGSLAWWIWGMGGRDAVVVKDLE